MNIPNTTPTPNELYNGEMKKMNGTELKVVMTTTRSTLGWEVDKQTGMRKKEDWISYYQLKQRTGCGYTALAKAIDKCVKTGWIEIRDKEGKLLDTHNKRIGKKLYYRLGRIFLDRIEPIISSTESGNVKSQITPTSSESEITESEAYKRNTNTKEYVSKADPLTKQKLKRKKIHKEITELFDFYKALFLKRISSAEPVFNWGACETLARPHIKSFGLEKMKRFCNYYLGGATDKQDKIKFSNCKWSLSCFLSTNSIHRISMVVK